MSIAFYLYLTAFLGFFTATELVKRRFRLKAEITRKVVHVGCSAIVCSMPFYISATEIYMLACGFISLLAVTRVTGIFTSVQGVKRKTIGEFTFAIGTALAVWLMLPDDPFAFVVGFLVLGISDTAAELVGSKYPIRRINIAGFTKSIGGATAFFVSALLIFIGAHLYLELPIAFWKVALGCALLALIELGSPIGIDNLLIPAATALVWGEMLTPSF